MTGINALIYVASTVPTSVLFRCSFHSVDVRIRWYLVDMWGRRIILMTGAAVVCEAQPPYLTVCSTMHKDVRCAVGYWMVDLC